MRSVRSFGVSVLEKKVNANKRSSRDLQERAVVELMFVAVPFSRYGYGAWCSTGFDRYRFLVHIGII
jgi:hypothetical protein